VNETDGEFKVDMGAIKVCVIFKKKNLRFDIGFLRLIYRTNLFAYDENIKVQKCDNTSTNTFIFIDGDNSSIESCLVEAKLYHCDFL
jgi:hypothetical protein